MALSTIGLSGTPGPIRTVTAKDEAAIAATSATYRNATTALAFDGWSQQYIETWAGFSAIELVYEFYGPEQARITAPASKSFWNHRRCMPGGRGVYLSFDPRGLGLPIWTGRLVNPQPSGSLDVSAQLSGPREWMDDYHTAMANSTTGSAAQIMRSVLELGRVNPSVDFDPTRAHRGPGGKEDLAGRSVWDTVGHLRESRGEWPYLEALEDAPRYRLEWRHALGGEDRTGELVLQHGVNSEWEAVPDIEGKVDELIMVFQSWGLGNRNYGSRARISPARAFGRRAALEAVVSSARLSNLTGASQSQVNLSSPTRDAAMVALESQLKRLANSSLPCRIEITDPSLWPLIRPGTIASGRWDDAHGIFGKCQVQIETMTVDLISEKMQLSGWLWDQDD